MMKKITSTKNIDEKFARDWKVRFYFIWTKNKNLNMYKDHLFN